MKRLLLLTFFLSLFALVLLFLSPPGNQSLAATCSESGGQCRFTYGGYSCLYGTNTDVTPCGKDQICCSQPSASSCPVCPSGYIWSATYQTCQSTSNTGNYVDPNEIKNCSNSSLCCNVGVSCTSDTSNGNLCGTSTLPPPNKTPENVYNCAQRDSRCSTSSYPNCKDFPYSYFYSCAPPYCVMHNLSGSNKDNWTTSCSWANGQPEPYSQPPPSSGGGGTQPGSGGTTSGFDLPPLGSLGIPGIPSGSAFSLQNIIRVSITLLLIGGVIFALAVLILSGIQWITSGGDKQKLQQARARIVYAIIGLIVIFASFFILNFIARFFGISFILSFDPPCPRPLPGGAPIPC